VLVRKKNIESKAKPIVATTMVGKGESVNRSDGFWKRCPRGLKVALRADMVKGLKRKPVNNSTFIWAILLPRGITTSYLLRLAPGLDIPDILKSYHDSQQETEESGY
jgi:hypothetical protein